MAAPKLAQEYIDEEPYFGDASPLVPANPTLHTLREAASACQACHLWRNASQTVFGEGLPSAKVMLIGEQPGDKEDLAGRPFVGPAGKLLDDSLEEAGIERPDVYVTNAVKHFKWQPVGARRIHQKPNRREIKACRPWLEAEISLVKPAAIVLLGATAAQALLGPNFKVTEHRGQLLDSALADFVLATVHPASILRAPDAEARAAAREAFTADLKLIALQL